MKVYKCKRGKLSGGSNYARVMRAARHEYRAHQINPRRHTYVRSKYFKKDKVFIDLFWDHIKQKRRPDKVRRLKLYACAIELIVNTAIAPTTKHNPNKPTEKLHRFAGQTKEGQFFYVQIKEMKTGRKNLLSIVPK